MARVERNNFSDLLKPCFYELFITSLLIGLFFFCECRVAAKISVYICAIFVIKLLLTSCQFPLPILFCKPLVSPNLRTTAIFKEDYADITENN